MSSSVLKAINQLERNDPSFSCIDIRGHSVRDSEQLNTKHSDLRTPRSVILTLTKAIRLNYISSQLKSFALHNNVLRRSEFSLLFDVICDLPSLETLVIFHHDLGDEGVGLLMDSLTGTYRIRGQKRPLFDNENTSSNHMTHAQDLQGDTSSPKTKCTVVNQLKNAKKTWGLKELYLSHCNIGCEGALKVSDALTRSLSLLPYQMTSIDNKMKCLQVLSLGSNRIEAKGASSLAKTFGESPFIHRLVLHGNEKIASSCSGDVWQYAMSPESWLQSFTISESIDTNMILKKTMKHSSSFDIIYPLIQAHIQQRWETDLVLVRPYEFARQRLLEEIYKKNSCYVDDNLEKIPELLSWMGRVGFCSKPSHLHSQLGFNKSGHSQPIGKNKCHSYGCEECFACTNIHLNDVYLLMSRMPHLINMLLSMRS